MLTITRIIASANGLTDKTKIEALESTLITQAANGVSVKDALSGHCPQAASNPTFIDISCSQLKNHDGGTATPSSALQAFIHCTDDEPEAKRRVPTLQEIMDSGYTEERAKQIVAEEQSKADAGV